MKNTTKRTIVQTRLNDDEVKMFKSLQKQLHCKNGSETMRALMLDANMVLNAAKMLREGRPEIAEELVKIAQKREHAPLTLAFLGMQGNNSSKKLGAWASTLSDLDSQLAGLNWLATNMSNNLNQVAHQVNIMMSEDPNNAKVWNWIIQSLDGFQLLANRIKNSCDSVEAKLDQGEIYVSDNLDRVS